MHVLELANVVDGSSVLHLEAGADVPLRFCLSGFAVGEGGSRAEGSDAAAGAAAAMLGLPQYQYFPYRTTLVGNIEGTNQLFSFEIALAVYDKKIYADVSMDVLAELELQLTPLILDQALGMSAEVLLSKYGRETLKVQIKDMLNETLEKWGHSPFVHAVEITSFVVT